MVYKVFDKTSSGSNTSVDAVKSEIMSKQCPLYLVTRELVEELHKPIIRKLEKQKVYSSFKDNMGC